MLKIYCSYNALRLTNSVLREKHSRKEDDTKEKIYLLKKIQVCYYLHVPVIAHFSDLILIALIYQILISVVLEGNRKL